MTYKKFKPSQASRWLACPGFNSFISPEPEPQSKPDADEEARRREQDAIYAQFAVRVS